MIMVRRYPVNETRFQMSCGTEHRMGAHSGQFGEWRTAAKIIPQGGDLFEQPAMIIVATVLGNHCAAEVSTQPISEGTVVTPPATGSLSI
jgi:hypothetical protein